MGQSRFELDSWLLFTAGQSLYLADAPVRVPHSGDPGRRAGASPGYGTSRDSVHSTTHVHVAQVPARGVEPRRTRPFPSALTPAHLRFLPLPFGYVGWRTRVALRPVRAQWMGRDSNPRVAMLHGVGPPQLYHTGRGQHRARLPGILPGLIHEGRRESSSVALSYPSDAPARSRTALLQRG